MLLVPLSEEGKELLDELDRGLEGERTRDHAAGAGRKHFYNVSNFIADLMLGKFTSKPAERLPLATAVLVRVGRETVLAVVSGYNPNDIQRVRVSWFDTVDRVVRHKFVDQQMVTVVEKQTAATA